MAELRRQIEEAAGSKGRALIDEALALAADGRTMDDPSERAAPSDTVAERAHEIAGVPAEEPDPDTGQPIPVYDQKRERKAMNR